MLTPRRSVERRPDRNADQDEGNHSIVALFVIDTLLDELLFQSLTNENVFFP